MEPTPTPLAAYWDQRNSERIAAGRAPFERLTAADFAQIEATWGYPLPDAYKSFVSIYGCVDFPDAFSGFTYVYARENGPRQEYQGDIAFLNGKDRLLGAHRHLIADPDNDTEEPFFPRFMLPFGNSAGSDLILLELGSDTPRVWYWEDQGDAFGRGDNMLLGYVAPSFEAFLAALRPYE